MLVDHVSMSTRWVLEPHSAIIPACVRRGSSTNEWNELRVGARIKHYSLSVHVSIKRSFLGETFTADTAYERSGDE
jgi:hypothetical protein